MVAATIVVITLLLTTIQGGSSRSMRLLWCCSRSAPAAFFVSFNSYPRHRCHRSPTRPQSVNPPSQQHRCSSTTTSLTLIDNRRTTTTDDYSSTSNDVITRYELNDQFSRWRFLQKLLEGDIPPSDVEDILLHTLSSYLQYGPTTDHTPANSSSSLSTSEKKDKDENGGNASPVLMPCQRIVMADIIQSIQLFDTLSSKDDESDDVDNNNGDRRFFSMLLEPNVKNVNAAAIDYESNEVNGDDDVMVEVDESALTLLECIEKNLLPDPIDNEDAYKGTWDVIIDLYGRESVRVSEDRLSKERDEKEEDEEGVHYSIRQTTLRRKNLQWRTLSVIGRVLIHFDLLTKGVLKEGAFASSSSTKESL